jgi:hypothetical protein
MSEQELGDAMREHFGSFGEVCFNLALIRKYVGVSTDNEIEVAFENFSRRHRRCFNKLGFIASCREPE